MNSNPDLPETNEEPLNLEMPLQSNQASSVAQEEGLDLGTEAALGVGEGKPVMDYQDAAAEKGQY